MKHLKRKLMVAVGTGMVAAPLLAQAASAMSFKGH